MDVTKAVLDMLLKWNQYTVSSLVEAICQLKEAKFNHHRLPRVSSWTALCHLMSSVLPCRHIIVFACHAIPIRRQCSVSLPSSTVGISRPQSLLAMASAIFLMVIWRPRHFWTNSRLSQLTYSHFTQVGYVAQQETFNRELSEKKNIAGTPRSSHSRRYETKEVVSRFLFGLLCITLSFAYYYKSYIYGYSTRNLSIPLRATAMLFMVLRTMY